MGRLLGLTAIAVSVQLLICNPSGAVETKTTVSFDEGDHQVLIEAPPDGFTAVEVYTSAADLEPDRSQKWVVAALSKHTVLHRGNHCRFGRVGTVIRRDLVKCPPGVGLKFHGGLGEDILHPRTEAVSLADPSNDPRLRFDGAVEAAGSEGSDILIGGPKPNSIAGGYGRDRITGGPAADLLIGDELGHAAGQEPDDPPRYLEGETDGDIIRGDDGRDSIFGEGGWDRLYGEEGDDRIISGGTGYDTIVGGTGKDLLVGWDVPISDDGGINVGQPPPIDPGAGGSSGERIYADERRLRNPVTGDPFTPPKPMEADRVYCQIDFTASAQFDDTDSLQHCLPDSIGDRYPIAIEPFGIDPLVAP